MQNKIKELYQKLYSQNIEILEEKKSKVKEEKVKNTTSVATSVISRIILRIVFFIVTLIIIRLVMGFMISNMTSDYRPGKESISLLLKFIIPASLIIGFIALIYQLAIRPRRSIQRNYWVKNSTDNKEEYNDIFCERICKPIIEYVIPNSKYEHSYGISQEMYENMGFSNSHETYTSTDNIELNNNSNLNLSKVHTKFKDGGADGYWHATLFCGIASIQYLTFNVPISIRIRNKKLDSLKLKNAIQLNNNEFDNYYQIETDNPELLNRYFDNNMIMYFIDLAKKNINLEMNILQNRICIRLHNKEFLNFTINSQVDEENIINSCNSIITVINTNDFIAKELKSNNIY